MILLKQLYNFSKESLDKINSDIDSMLIYWSLMIGKYEDGVIRTTKLGTINMLFALTLFLFKTLNYNIISSNYLYSLLFVLFSHSF